MWAGIDHAKSCVWGFREMRVVNDHLDHEDDKPTGLATKVLLWPNSSIGLLKAHRTRALPSILSTCVSVSTPVGEFSDKEMRIQ